MEGQSHYRRPLPEALVSFSSPDGRQLFREALDAGHMAAFFPLIEQFHTQADPAYCGLASLVMALNALGVDPGRVWRGPWRWFSEELLDCCTPLSEVQRTGVTLEQVMCLARCNGAEGTLARPSTRGMEAFRSDVSSATSSSERVLVLGYSRATLGQTGAGHFSPIGGYHAGKDHVLVLDVARFKYPPYWAPLSLVFEAMLERDPQTARERGWLVLEKRGSASAIAHTLRCRAGIGIKEVLERLVHEQQACLRAAPPRSLAELFALTEVALDASGLNSEIEFTQPAESERARAFAQLHELFLGLPLFRALRDLFAPERAAVLALWMFAAPASAWVALEPELARELAPLLDATTLPEPLRPELGLLQSQVQFLLEHAG
jgi:glutathione gamma-glutamylcysteinyltransferase